MIIYENTGHYRLLNLLLTRGSVFPRSLVIAIPAAIFTGVLRALVMYDYIPWLQGDDAVMTETQAWSGFSFLVGFLIVFRTNMAYNRFWDGCTSTHAMRAEWFDAASSLIAFCKHSKEIPAKVERFKHILVRLFSMLHAAALAEIEDEEDEERCLSLTFDLIDAWGIDEASMKTIQESDARVELIFEWIQMLVVENINTGVLSIPPPILSRAFQEVANGMVQFHEAFKISTIPFPFPYAQTCDCLLVIHWIVVPFVTSAWVARPVWAAIFAFVQVFILWALNFIATEIENPFGQDPNDISGQQMQDEMNKQLLLLLAPTTQKTPDLSPFAVFDPDPGEIDKDELMRKSSFKTVWDELERKRRMSRHASEGTIVSVLQLEQRPSFNVFLKDGFAKAAGQKFNEPKRVKDNAATARRRRKRRLSRSNRSVRSSEPSESDSPISVSGGQNQPWSSMSQADSQPPSQTSSGSLSSDFANQHYHRASSPRLEVNFGRRERSIDVSLTKAQPVAFSSVKAFDLSPEHRYSGGGETTAFSIEIPKTIPSIGQNGQSWESLEKDSDTLVTSVEGGASNLGLRDVAKTILEPILVRGPESPAILAPLPNRIPSQSESRSDSTPEGPPTLTKDLVSAPPVSQQVRLQWHTAGDKAAGPEVLTRKYTSEGDCHAIEV
eukprot:CAMPEP_0178382434 /NCGR_PEP_ID=MMETSP0689_2-20121128/6490_1 /TAXON_ID=160604 /ORGANISM="Amphidinium massartii, Strain CS-259" /LENGTH=665 /DNA_ID=CAMNT_0020002635 /DNA_START=33 /DNA_END=2030 /DNA_ORIENTATION=+